LAFKTLVDHRGRSAIEAAGINFYYIIPPPKSATKPMSNIDVVMIQCDLPTGTWCKLT